MKKRWQKHKGCLYITLVLFVLTSAAQGAPTLGLKKTVVEGEIVERSKLPDPQRSAYPNCRFTIHFKGNAIISGEPCPRELALVVEGFENHRILPNDRIKIGDKVRCEILPFEQLPDDYKSTQQADDLQLFLLECYYATDIKIIKRFADNEVMPASGIYFSAGNEKYISLFDRRINPPIPSHVIDAQKISINRDIEKMNVLLDGLDFKNNKIKQVNRRFREAWEKEKAKDLPNFNRICTNGKYYVWRNLENSFWTLPENYYGVMARPYKLSPRMLDCFLSLKRALEANGVQLIVSLVPRMNVISARVMVNEYKDFPDIQTATYVKQLSEIGVETIYASDQIIKNYNRYPFAFFFPEDEHPSDTAQDVLSDILADRLKRYEISQLPASLFSEIRFSHQPGKKSNFLFPKNCDIGENKAGESYTYREILYKGDGIKRTKTSPIMVVGNSYVKTPMNKTEALPALLSYKLNSPIDYLRISGHTIFSVFLIQLLSNPELYLKGKQVLIIQIGTIHLTTYNLNDAMVLDIAKLDRERVLLNNKKKKGNFCLKSNADVNEPSVSESLGSLSSIEKTVLKIGETGELTYNIKIKQFGSNINDFDPIVCIVPHTCVCKNTNCKATINGKTEIMHSPLNAQSARFYNLIYELPAGTKEIKIKIEGKPGTLIAIKDIQIWQ